MKSSTTTTKMYLSPTTNLYKDKMLIRNTKVLPGKADPSAGPVGVAEDASGNGLTEGLQHVLQL